jgi:hypothetical protein
VRRIAVLTTQLEMLETKFAGANGEAAQADLDLYIRASGILRRHLQTISKGLERRTKPVPSLDDYLASKRRETAEVAT